MKIDWTKNEKQLLAHLFLKMGNKDFLWRDDAIIVPLAKELSLLYSIDNAEQIYNYQIREKNMRCYGRWATAVISNDIIACGTEPCGIAFDFGIKDKSEEDFMEFVKGVLDICNTYGMRYEGGNINTTESISGIAWGVSNNTPIIRREVAMNGDILLVTCELGVGWAKKLLANQSSSVIEDSYKEFPVVNLNMFREIWSKNIIHCGMDLTNGLIEFAYEIKDRTGYGVILNIKESSNYLNMISNKLNIPEIALRLELGYDTPYAHGWCGFGKYKYCNKYSK